ncbi:MAG TPA: YraN family protein [Chloroflexota bacterium]|nr:YraN family protein [Chloroflexota bacterium]
MSGQKSYTRGQAAERLAVGYLTRHGYTILETNVRVTGGEIDAVADDHGTLVFVEVRARRSGVFGDAADSIGPQKRRRVYRAAEVYLQARQIPPSRPCRIDVVTIQLDSAGQAVRVDLIKNAVEAG